MTADQPLVCPTCRGVIVAAHATAYTPARGRLIIANGYCRGTCSDAGGGPGHDDPGETAAPVSEPTSAGAS